MRISELSEQSGVSVATVKYYLREGLLLPGKALNARESVYDESHLARLRLIRGLVHSLGASIDQVKKILTIIDTPDQSPLDAMCEATLALPAIRESEESLKPSDPDRALPLLKKLGYNTEPDLPAVKQLNTALELAESIGIGIDEDLIATYSDATRRIAEADFERIPWDDPDAATTFAVLGTAIYEPILLALRRLAHQDLGLELHAQYEAPAALPSAETEA